MECYDCKNISVCHPTDGDGQWRCDSCRHIVYNAANMVSLNIVPATPPELLENLDACEHLVHLLSLMPVSVRDILLRFFVHISEAEINENAEVVARLVGLMSQTHGSASRT